MSIVESSLSKTATAETDLPMLSPEQALDQFRALRKQIPGFVHLPNDRQMQKIRRTARVNINFTREAISAVGTSEVVQTVIGNTPEELHRAEDEVARWTIVESEMRSMLQGIAAANLVRRHRLGLVALQAYSVSRQLVRQEDHADLLPHVQTMSRLPKYDRRRVKSAVPPAADPAKAPQPANPS